MRSWCGLVFAFFMSCAAFAGTAQDRFALKVFPPEHQKVVDDKTGAELVYITTNPAWEHNLYFHEHSWLPDSSMIIFYSKREPGGGLMGYLTATGELVQLATPEGALTNASAAVDRNSVYATQGNKAVELALTIEASADCAKEPSKVWATARVIAELPKGAAAGALNPNSNGKLLATGAVKTDDGLPARVITINIKTGKVKTAYTVPAEQQFAYHVQWSHENPDLLSFAAIYPRLNVVNVRTGKAYHPYLENPGELVTHEHWWVDNQLAFCGGVHPKPIEEGHVKVVDVFTGKVRIIGAGAWWEGANGAQLARYNHWHCAGSDDGRWVVSDNWYGDLWLHDATTARSTLLTHDHRTYGKGDHPEMGWDPKGEKIVFCSHKLGNPNVCVVTIPKNIQDSNKTPARTKKK